MADEPSPDAAARLPRRPGRRGGPVPPIPGRYKVAPEDFVVEELPAYVPSGAGEHLWLWVEKRGVATMDLVPRLARCLDIHPREVGYAGLKDAKAITRQWLSVPSSCEPRLGDFDAIQALLREGPLQHAAECEVSLVERTRHTNKLKLGHLRGNRFRIVLRDSSVERLDDARALLADLAARGVPNGFGEQRFGNRGGNLAKGLAILTEGRLPKMPKRVLRLVLSSVQSEVFNRVLAARLATIDRLENGDVAFLHRNGACFEVVEAAAEQSRCASFELSPSGPLPGPKTLRAQGAQGELEAAALAELGLAAESFDLPQKLTEGARRPLRVPLWDPEVSVEGEDLVLAFGLPRGAYATSVLREILVDAPWFDDAKV